MRSGATCSAGRAKKDWERAGRVLVAVGVALGGGWRVLGGMKGITKTIGNTQERPKCLARFLTY